MTVPISHDAVNHPSHYTNTRFTIECHEVVRYMGFDLGNATKYLWRRDGKGSHDQDVAKARVYLEWSATTREPLYVSGSGRDLVIEHLAPVHVHPFLVHTDPLDRALFNALRGNAHLALAGIDEWLRR